MLRLNTLAGITSFRSQRRCRNLHRPERAVGSPSTRERAPRFSGNPLFVSLRESSAKLPVEEVGHVRDGVLERVCGEASVPTPFSAGASTSHAASRSSR